jgi:hypothetical protein
MDYYVENVTQYFWINNNVYNRDNRLNLRQFNLNGMIVRVFGSEVELRTEINSLPKG